MLLVSHITLRQGTAGVQAHSREFNRPCQSQKDGNIANDGNSPIKIPGIGYCYTPSGWGHSVYIFLPLSSHPSGI